MSRLKYYVDPKKQGENAEDLARALQDAFTEVGIGVGPAQQTSKPRNPQEEAKLRQVRTLEEQLASELRRQDSATKPDGR